MNFIPCLTWVAKGIPKSCPDKLQLSAEELKKLVEETKEMARQTADDSEEDDELLSDVEKNEISFENQPQKNNDENSNNEEDFESRYNLDAYDDDEGDNRPFMNIGDVAVYVDNKEDNYLEKSEEVVNEDEEEELENFLIKANDNLLVVGHVEEDSSVLEVYVYNKEDDALYVHHDIVLPAYPLALEWLNFHPSDETPGNYVAVGDMSPIIKIYDLDVVDILEPDYCLGEEPKKKKQIKLNKNYHEDAVISLSWNKHTRNILASGSADSSIILWDLQEGVPLNKLNIHTGKVQSLQWHPFESPFLLSGCTNGLINVYDCRDPNSECKSWSVEGEIERVLWNLFDSLKLFCSTDTGFVHSIDMRNNEIECSLKVHNEGVTGLDMCQERKNILLTGSMDKTVKIWNIENGFTLLKSQKLKVGSIYIAKFSPDSGLSAAVGGNNASHSLKILDVAEMLDGDDSNSKKPKFIETTNVNISNAPPKKKIKMSNKLGNSDDAIHCSTFEQKEKSKDVKMAE